jgi:GNAT superfamily N-acetyltransferase
MNNDGISVTEVAGREALTEFAALPFQIYASYPAWWPPDIDNEIDLLAGRSPICAYLDMQPFAVRNQGRLVARVTAIVNHRYNEHWHERMGQLIHFEALPEQDAAVGRMLECAMRWLRQAGMDSVRSGFAAFLDYPYAIDNYGKLSSFLLRGNPDYYHCYFKNSGFRTEKGMLDFTVPLQRETLMRYPGMVEVAQRHGAVVQSWQDFGYADAVDAWTDVINAAFAQHWGWNPITREEVRPMLMALAQTEVAELSTVATVGGQPVGVMFAVPDFSPRLAQIRPGTKVAAERGGGSRGALINIGVLAPWRGKGINLALAAHSFLRMAQLRIKYAGYTLVLDDNWASRRTAVKLGGAVSGNFVVYRHDFGQDRIKVEV